MQKELLEYVPLGDNYYVGPDSGPGNTVYSGFNGNTVCSGFNGNTCQGNNCSKSKCTYDDIYPYPLFEKRFNNLKCNFFMDSYYHNSTENLGELMKKIHISIEHNVIVSSRIFEIIAAQQKIKKYNFRDYTTIRYQKCIYDATKKEAYEYVVAVKDIVKFISSVNPMIYRWLETVPNKGFTDKDIEKDRINPESYESLYKNSLLTIRQHTEMYHRDRNQCNHNTVNHGITYMLSLNQNQFDFLRDIYIDDPNLPELHVSINFINETNGLIKFLDQKHAYLHRSLKLFEDEDINHKKVK